MPSLPSRALLKAISQIGQKEKPLGSNWGVPVQDYLKSVGITVPASWCAAFVYWCFENALNEGEVNPLIKTGGVLLHWTKADKKYRVVGDPKPGDVFIMDFGGGKGHTGIVESVTSSQINTIEGNANETAGREGTEVRRKTRSRSKIKGYLRYDLPTNK